MTDETFPALPLEPWEDTKITLHLWLQILGKVRMALFPRMNHWWHVPLYVSSRGLTTRFIPYRGRSFEIELDAIDPALEVRDSTGRSIRTPLAEGTSVAEFHDRLFDRLAAIDVDVRIRGVPYEHVSKTPFAEDREHDAFDTEAVRRFWRVLTSVGGVFETFRGRFMGKSTLVHLFWHSFDLAVTRFSGRAAPRESGGPVDREAYSHEVVSFGFWAGDENVREPMFYSYTYPAPDGVDDESLKPEGAFWTEVNGSPMALFPYASARSADDPGAEILAFLESAYQAGAGRANWDLEAFATPGTAR